MTLNIKRVLFAGLAILAAAAPQIQTAIQLVDDACNGGIGCGI